MLYHSERRLLSRADLKLYVPKLFVQIFVTLVGMLIGIFLMVGDEIIGVINPSRGLVMHWPLGLVFTIWQSWEIVFMVILVCTILLIILIEYLLRDAGVFHLGSVGGN
jgi:hypothetical protein